jgi:hypothetical protein
MGSPILQLCSFAPPGLCYSKLPPLRTSGSPWDEPLRPGIHRHLPSPPGHVPHPHHRPAQPCRSSVWLGQAPQPCTISALPASLPRPAQLCRSSLWLGCTPQNCTISALLAMPQSLHSPAQYSLCKAMPLRPAKQGTHTHDLHSAGPCPPSLSSQGYTDMQYLHSTALYPSGTPSPCSKGPLLHLS